LTHLDIGDCELTNKGMNQLLPFLLQADLLLEFFNVCNNELSFMCCDGLANLLHQQRPTLGTLHASSNQFTNQGVEILMSAYSNMDDYNPAHLWSIDYSTNELGHGAMLALVDAHLPNLQTITLSGNCFRPNDVRKLQDRFGTALQELEENDEDSMSYDEVGDKESGEIEEEVEAPQPEHLADLFDMSPLVPKEVVIQSLHVSIFLVCFAHAVDFLSLSCQVETHCKFSRVLYSQGDASPATPEMYTLEVGGDQLVPVKEEEAECIVARL
jgi:hypothetical protein